MCALMLFANNVRANLSGESMPRKGAAGQVRDQPKQTFADILPLASAKLQSRSDKNAIDRRTVADKKNSRQVAGNAAKSKDQFVPANRETPSAPIDPPERGNQATVKKGDLRRSDKKAGMVDGKKEKANTVVAMSPNMTQPQVQTGEPKQEKTSLPSSAAEPVSPRRKSSRNEAAEPQTLIRSRFTVADTETSAGKGTVAVPPQAVAGREVVQPGGDGAAVPSSTAIRMKQVQVQSPGGTEFRGRSAQDNAEQVQREHPAGRGDKLIGGAPRSTPRGAEASGQRALAAVVKQHRGVVNLRAQGTQLKDAGLNMPVEAKVASKDTPAIAGDKTNQIPEKPQVVKQDLGTEIPPRTYSKSNGSRPDARQNVVWGRETNYVSRSVREEPVQADRKAAAAPGSRDGLQVQAETTAPASSQPIFADRFYDTTRIGTDGAAIKSPSQTIGEQILDSMRASVARGDNQLLIRLHPPELGTVLVRFREQDGRISGLVEVAESDTRQQIEQALPQVLRSLQEAGVEVQKLEVVTSGPSEREFGRGHSQQEAWSQPHGGGQDRDHPPTPSQARWGPSGESYPADFQEMPSVGQQASLANDRVDVLL